MPDDIRSIARQMVEDYGHDPHGLLAGAICGAIIFERMRCAEAAECLVSSANKVGENSADFLGKSMAKALAEAGSVVAKVIREGGSPERGKVEA